jgi:hypothetical protein
MGAVVLLCQAVAFGLCGRMMLCCVLSCVAALATAAAG